MTTTRRAVLLGAGAAGLAVASGCAVYGNQTPPPPAAPPGGGGGAGGASPGAGGGASDEPAAALARVSDIPVGGGTILSDAQVVITQPTAGTFACFGAVCTHQGCLVTEVADGTINCPCHGSRFNLADGSVASGPAPQPLPAVPITVEGDTIRRT